jgi:hypothetical protein
MEARIGLQPNRITFLFSFRSAMQYKAPVHDRSLTNRSLEAILGGAPADPLYACLSRV